MSDYKNKLLSLVEKKQKLIDEEKILIEKRKKEIGELAQKFNLLTSSDELLAGLFIDAQGAVNDKSDKVKSWETLGGRFLKKPKSPKTKKD